MNRVKEWKIEIDTAPFLKRKLIDKKYNNAFFHLLREKKIEIKLKTRIKVLQRNVS